MYIRKFKITWPKGKTFARIHVIFVWVDIYKFVHGFVVMFVVGVENVFVNVHYQ